MTREEFEQKVFEMILLAAGAKAIGDEIADKLSPFGDEDLYKLLNEIQNCEVTEMGTALEIYENIRR